MDVELHNIEADSKGQLKDLSKSDNIDSAPAYLIDGETAFLYNLKEYTYAIRQPGGTTNISWNDLKVNRQFENKIRCLTSNYGIGALVLRHQFFKDFENQIRFICFTSPIITVPFFIIKENIIF